MRVYHFINSKYGLEDLEKKRLKIARIDDLNDPFELLGPSSKDKKVRQAFLDLKGQLNQFSGILCFSKDWVNPVQWSHYADGHKGMCLGFDDPDDKVIPVRYRPKRFEPDLSIIGGPVAEAQAEMLKVISTKYSHWRYENEVRIFVALDEMDENTKLYFAEFSDELQLREVVVGHQSKVTRAELKEAVGNSASKIEMFKARLAFRSFKVVRQKQAGLWN